MTKARLQPFCIVNTIYIGYFNGKEAYLRSVTEKNEALCSCTNHLCLFWESDGVSVEEAMVEIQTKITIVNNRTSPNNANSVFRYEYKRIKIESQLINFNVYNPGTFKTDRVVPYCVSLN